MEPGRASKTAFRVAIRRAAHQVMEQPRILDDPIVARLVGAATPRDMERAQHTVARDFRASMAARSRYAEDRLAEAVAAGVAQNVVLGAGLDTFAYRNPFAGLRVFEVDLPATQAWKRGLLAEAEIPIPADLAFVPLDLERKSLSEGLAEAGFDASAPACFSWLGVVPYLTLAAFRATLDTIAALPAVTSVSFDYVLQPETLSPQGRQALDGLARRVAAAGEPFQLFFKPEEIDAELRDAGFRRAEQIDSAGLNRRYFAGRADGLRLSEPGLAMLVTAWV